jgi:hypothetical protein
MQIEDRENLVELLLAVTDCLTEEETLQIVLYAENLNAAKDETRP